VSLARFGEDDDAVLLSLESGYLYRCNPTAALFLSAVASGKTSAEIAEEFRRRYDVGPEELRADLAGLADMLSREGLIAPAA
jgi:hypothetical protein